MRQRPAGGPEQYLSRAAFRPRNQFRQRVDAQRRIHRDHHRLLADHPDRDEVACEIERHFGLRLRQHHEGRCERQIERMSVRWRRSGGLRGDDATATRPVDHQHLLSPGLSEAVRDDPCDDIRTGACCRSATGS